MNDFKDTQIKALQDILEHKLKHLELCKAVLNRMGEPDIWIKSRRQHDDPSSEETLYFGVEDPSDLIKACLEHDKERVLEICPYIEELLPINLSM